MRFKDLDALLPQLPPEIAEHFRKIDDFEKAVLEVIKQKRPDLDATFIAGGYTFNSVFETMTPEQSADEIIRMQEAFNNLASHGNQKAR